MRAQRWIQWFTVFVLITVVAGASAADPAMAGADGSLPPESESAAEAAFTPYVDRTIPVPPLYFLYSLSLTAARPERSKDRSTFGAGLGSATGLADRLTAEGLVGPLELGPEVRLRSLRFGLLYDLIDAPLFELEPTVHVNLSPGGVHLLSQVEPGLMMALHGKGAVRLDAGAYLPISRGEKTAVGISLPARAVVQVTRRVHTAMSTGAFVSDLAGVRRSTTVPLGFAAGYSAPLGERLTITVTPTVSWPSFLAPFEADPVHTRAWAFAVVTDLVLHP